MNVLILAVLGASMSFASALQKALESKAEWRMERRLHDSSRVIVSSGTVDCVAGSGIVWKVVSPFESSVAMTKNEMVFADDDGVRVKKLDDLPHYAEIRKRTDAFVAGDSEAFAGLFRSETVDGDKGGWRVVLTPEVSEMRRWFDRIELSGTLLPTGAVLRLPDGGSTAIRFRKVPRVK